MKSVLLAETQIALLQELRSESRRAGVCFVYQYADSRQRFLQLLSHRPAIVVTSLLGVHGMDFEELAQEARALQIPVLVIAGDTEKERAALSTMRDLHALTCRRSRLQWLPTLLERAVHEREQQQEREHIQELAEASEQLLHAAEQVREVQRLAIIGRLTGSIVHEINNPLESITNLIYLMHSDDALPQHMRPYLDMVQAELNRVSQISKQTLSFYRETQSPARVELSALLEEVLALYGRRLNEKRLEIVKQFHAEEPVTVFPGEVRQVLSNLIANAIEASEAHSRIVVRLRRSTRWNGKATAGMRVLVADGGSGIPAEVRRKLGQPFYTTKGQRGTGLGLWVSQSILKRYGAEMRMRSSTRAARRGTTFSIFVPFVLRPRVVEFVPPPASKGQGPHGKDAESLELIRLRASSS